MIKGLIKVSSANGEIQIETKAKKIKITKSEIDNVLAKSKTVKLKEDELKDKIKLLNSDLDGVVDVHLEGSVMSVCVGEIISNWWVV